MIDDILILIIHSLGYGLSFGGMVMIVMEKQRWWREVQMYASFRPYE